MKSMTTLGLLSVLSAFGFAGCATGGESETESLGETQQAITLDAASPAASVATKGKKDVAMTHLAGALGTTTVTTSGHTLDTNLVVPANTTVTCSTCNATSMDTVLALMVLQNPYAANQGPSDPDYNAKKGWNLVGFSDDHCGTQSTVTWHNTDNIPRNVRLMGFLYGTYTNFGTATVTCSGADQTSINGNFASNSRVIANPSTTITLTSDVENPDTGLLAIWVGSGARDGVGSDTDNTRRAQLPNGNSTSNEDCPAGGPVDRNQSCLMDMTTGGNFWIVDVGGWGSVPRTSTVTF